MKKIMFLLVLALVCNLTAVPLAHADNSAATAHQWQRHENKNDRQIFKQLHLTKDQKNQLKENKKQTRIQMKVYFQQIKTYHQALQQELMKPQLDMNAVTAIHAKLKTVVDQMADQRLNSILTVRKILTPEQFAKFNQLMQKRQEQRKQRKRAERS